MGDVVSCGIDLFFGVMDFLFCNEVSVMLVILIDFEMDEDELFSWMFFD